MYVVRLTNFNRVIYRGKDLDAAMDAAVESGFECTLEGYGVTMAWSPIGGWRHLQGAD